MYSFCLRLCIPCAHRQLMLFILFSLIACFESSELLVALPRGGNFLLPSAYAPDFTNTVNIHGLR